MDRDLELQSFYKTFKSRTIESGSFYIFSWFYSIPGFEDRAR